MTTKRHKPTKSVPRTSAPRRTPRETLDEQYGYLVRYLDNQYRVRTDELEKLLPATHPSTARLRKQLDAKLALYHKEIESRLRIFRTIADNLLQKEEARYRGLLAAARDFHKVVAGCE